MIKDTSERIFFDYLNPDKPSSLVAYRESGTEVGLWLESEHKWKSISKNKFLENIDITTKNATYKNIKVDHSRIPVNAPGYDAMSHCQFILAGLKGLKAWHADGNGDINPLSLFNQGLKRLK